MSSSTYIKPAFRLSITAGPTEEDGRGSADVALVTTPALFTGLLLGQIRIDDAIADGRLAVTGSKAESRRFFRIFTAAAGRAPAARFPLPSNRS